MNTDTTSCEAGSRVPELAMGRDSCEEHPEVDIDGDKIDKDFATGAADDDGDDSIEIGAADDKDESKGSEAAIPQWDIRCKEAINDYVHDDIDIGATDDEDDDGIDIGATDDEDESSEEEHVDEDSEAAIKQWDRQCREAINDYVQALKKLMEEQDEQSALHKLQRDSEETAEMPEDDITARAVRAVSNGVDTHGTVGALIKMYERKKEEAKTYREYLTAREETESEQAFTDMKRLIKNFVGQRDSNTDNDRRKEMNTCMFPVDEEEFERITREAFGPAGGEATPCNPAPTTTEECPRKRKKDDQGDDVIDAGRVAKRATTALTRPPSRADAAAGAALMRARMVPTSTRDLSITAPPTISLPPMLPPTSDRAEAEDRGIDTVEATPTKIVIDLTEF